MQRILAAYADHYLRPCLSDILNGSPSGGVLPASFAFFAASLYQLLADESAAVAADRCLVIVTPSNQEAETLAGEALLCLEPAAVAYFPGYENIPYEYSSSSSDIALQRIRVLSRIAAGERLLVFTSADAVLRRMPHPDRLGRLSRVVRVDDELPPRDLLRALVDMGYQREERVEAPGQFALKGSVLDVYPVNGDQPARIDYFDDFIESIRAFNANTQLGADRIQECEILPAGEVVLDGDESARLRTALQKYHKESDASGLSARGQRRLRVFAISSCRAAGTLSARRRKHGRLCGVSVRAARAELSRYRGERGRGAHPPRISDALSPRTRTTHLP